MTHELELPENSFFSPDGWIVYLQITATFSMYFLLLLLLFLSSSTQLESLLLLLFLSSSTQLESIKNTDARAEKYLLHRSSWREEHL